MRSSLAALVAAVLSLGALPACRDDTVVVVFSPAVDDRYEYETVVTSETVVELQGRAPQRTTDRLVLHAAHHVIAVDDGGVQVVVAITTGPDATREYLVRFDRAQQLEAIEAIEGVPTAELGVLGVTEIVPAAVDAPPEGELRPGQRWTIRAPVTLPGAARAVLLTGTGRLVSVGVVDGHEIARIRTRLRVPVDTVTATATGRLHLAGTQDTDVEAAHDLRDGSVRSSSSTTTATFTIELAPPAGTEGVPVPGTLTLRTRAETRRVT